MGDSEMGAPEGLLSVFLISGLLLGTCLGEQACVDDACFDQSIQKFKIERSKTDQTSGLNYKEQTTDLVATIDVIGVCLPGVNPSVLADSFLSCSNEKVEEVCTMVKRGWLEEREGKSVVNENALVATFKGLNGGEDAVRECLQIPEVYEYDYLEESASGSRQRRAVGDNKKKGKETKTNDKTGKKGKGKGKKGPGKNRKNPKNSKSIARKAARRARKQGGKKARKATKKAGKRAEDKAAKKAAKKAKQAKKAERKADKKAKEANGEKDARKKALSKLGLKKMPSKSILQKLECVQDKITELLIGCAKNILSKTN